MILKSYANHQNVHTLLSIGTPKHRMDVSRGNMSNEYGCGPLICMK